MDSKELRYGVYAILAEAFKEPAQEFVKDQREVVKFLYQAFTGLDYDIAMFDYQDWPERAADLEKLKDEYYRSFIYPPATRVVPVESIYRQWTYDETAQVPFAKEKGYFMSDAALHMKALYGQYGLEIPPEFNSMPDHLCLELEFAAFLLQNENEERQRIFIREHLDWVSDLYREAVEKEIPGYYLALIKVTAKFLECEQNRILQLSHK